MSRGSSLKFLDQVPPWEKWEGWSGRVQGVEMGRQHETVVGLLPAIWRSLGTREVHWGFQGVDEDLIWNLPISHQHNPIKTVEGLEVFWRKVCQLEEYFVCRMFLKVLSGSFFLEKQRVIVGRLLAV